ncbi:BsuBI/PstI family type II restriction endonuclease [Sutcliffiella cohnii]|uniref:BsuBI/PstI family type II restriction endonuclease n=1 Tax=Sutcliffiella cohnii TaxID=33932 RepID=UPI002E23FA0C|nr:BsuBI/PstI family type II restriction endonuclease [Sutcliffiella cohnii]MED4016285.1 BsuBI/PstI family type II restriction endonuclease [Sutcliffiella cohnii]
MKIDIEEKTTLSLLEYVEMLSFEMNLTVTEQEKKEKGQYFTSVSIGMFMAELVLLNKSTLKVLDPGSGTGILIASLVERIIREQKNVNIEVDLYENDEKVLPFLEKSMLECRRQMEQIGNEFSYTIINDDFILSNSYLFEDTLFTARKDTMYDVVISNPPYFKVNKNHEYSVLLKEYVHGQPNVYFMFMAIAEKLLDRNGQLVFITPRSYCSGAYFEKFRSIFFKNIDPDQIHLFTSRKGNFKGEKVLQENVILSGFKRKIIDPHITISSSLSSEIKESYFQETFVKSLIIDSSDQVNLIRLPINMDEQEILELFDNWTNNLSLMNMNISTGPVITFRHKDFIKSFDEGETFPLLFMKNIKNMEVVFPLGNNDEGLTKESAERKLAIPSNNYVLLKRFTSKEQKKRVDVAVYNASQYDFKMIGLENHLNYIYTEEGSLTIEETYGIAAFLNSNLVDKYFRIVNGNTQVNASDIRPLPFPEHDFITELGKGIVSNEITYEDVDELLKNYYRDSKESVGGNIVGRENEAMDVLVQLGLPRKQQNQRSALTLLALLNLKENDQWSNAEKRNLRVVDIMDFMAEHYDKRYAPNSRETIRRQTIHQFEQANLIERNPDDPSRPTNSGNTVYAVTDEFLSVARSYGSEEWTNTLNWFKGIFSTLTEKYERKRNINRVPIQIKDDIVLYLSAGEHNILQKHIVEDFAAIFAQGSELLYLGDTANKSLVNEQEKLEKLNIPLAHDKLPDVILYDETKNWIYLIEAVTSHGPISDKRYYELEKMFERCPAGKVYVTAFPDIKTFKTYADDIAWETEVWFADMPEHMMHLNGDRFMGPR